MDGGIRSRGAPVRLAERASHLGGLQMFMSRRKWVKLATHPVLFFRDMRRKRIARNADKKGGGLFAGSAERLVIPSAFNLQIAPLRDKLLRIRKPVFLYQSWIPGTTDSIVDAISSSSIYDIEHFDLWSVSAAADAQRRRQIMNFIREHSDSYRAIVINRLLPIRHLIKGFIFTYDWHPTTRIISNVCRELGIPRILIPHESVFSDQDQFYTHQSLGICMPEVDVALVWGDLQEAIFKARGYPAERIEKLGTPKFDGCSSFSPRLTRNEAYSLIGLDPAKKTILFALQPMDVERDQERSRQAQMEAVERLLDLCVQQDWQLVLRMPPAETHLLKTENEYKQWRALKSHPLVFVDLASTRFLTPHEAIAFSDIVVSFNSTMLLEAALMGKPALALPFISEGGIWGEFGLPKAESPDRMLHLVQELVKGELPLLDERLFERAKRAFSIGEFDGCSSERITRRLEAFAQSDILQNRYASPIERLIEDSGTVDVVVTQSDKYADTRQKYLLPMLGAKSRLPVRRGIAYSALSVFMVWGAAAQSKAKREYLAIARQHAGSVLIVEAGFIWGTGIGANDEPGLSIIIDDKAAYYDATRESRLAWLLNSAWAISDAELERSRAALELLRQTRVTKYNHAPVGRRPLPDATQKRLLLIDQRYGDLSVVMGMADEKSFIGMLREAVDQHPNWEIVVKQHPDATVAGMRSYLTDEVIQNVAGDTPVTVITDEVNPYDLFDVVDKVFVVTSGMGFEALIAGKEVHCFGMPFYAGWGITHDRLPSPRRRSRKLEEIFFIAYLKLSRYFDPTIQKRGSFEDVVTYLAGLRHQNQHEAEPQPEKCLALKGSAVADRKEQTVSSGADEGKRKVIIPRADEIRDNLSKLLARQKKSPDDAKVLARIAELHAKLDQHQEAMTWYRRAVAIGQKKKLLEVERWARGYETSKNYEGLKQEFRDLHSGVALHRVMAIPGITTVLDVGSGGGKHARILTDAGKKVTCVDYGRSVYYDRTQESAPDVYSGINVIHGDYLAIDVGNKFDLVWASHVLEHQRNVGLFIDKLIADAKEGGWLCITVPPAKPFIVGGHLTLWNAGLLLYNLVLAGLDCSQAEVLNYGYNISVIVQNRRINLPELDYDSGDVDRLSKYFPRGCKENFDGRFYTLLDTRAERSS